MKKNNFGETGSSTDGMDHGIYALISYIAVYMIFKIKLAIYICFIVNTIVWFVIEYKQEKAMGRGLEKKPLKWSKSRMADMGWPFVIGLVAMYLNFHR